MFARRVFYKRASGASKKSFSTGSAEEPKSGVGKVLAFVSNNRQQLVNIVGIYLVVSFGVHNFKVQKAWEQKQLEGKHLLEENEALKASLLNKEWIESVEKKVRASKPAQNVLQSELEANINATVASIAVANKAKTDQTASAATVDPLSKALEAELSATGTLPAGVKVSSSDSGRVI